MISWGVLLAFVIQNLNKTYIMFGHHIHQLVSNVLSPNFIVLIFFKFHIQLAMNLIKDVMVL